MSIRRSASRSRNRRRTANQPRVEGLEGRQLLSGGSPPYTAASFTTTVVVGDFNGDGASGLATAPSSRAGVSVRLNRGDGTFGAPIVAALHSKVSALTSADFDEDGRLDLAVGSRGDRHDVRALLGRGDGTFRESARLMDQDVEATRAHLPARLTRRVERAFDHFRRRVSAAAPRADFDVRLERSLRRLDARLARLLTRVPGAGESPAPAIRRSLLGADADSLGSRLRVARVAAGAGGRSAAGFAATRVGLIAESRLQVVRRLHDFVEGPRSRIDDPALDDPGNPPPVPLPSPATAPPPPVGPLQVHVLAAGYYSGVTTDQEAVFRDSEAWARFYAEHASTFFPKPEVPAVDFEREMVIAILRSHSTGGYTVGLDGVTVDREGTVVVDYTETYPGPGSLVAAVLTQPYVFVAVPRSDAPVVFRRVERSR